MIFFLSHLCSREKNNSAMGKKGGGNKKGTSVTPIHQRINTMREEKCGRKQIKGGSSNIKATLKLQHLQNLAVWASEEAAVPSLGAFFGQRLAASQEAIGVSPDSSLFSCQRCESILHSGYNCTVRIEKKRGKAKKQRIKPKVFTLNNVVYTCNFCSHRNLKRGTAKGYMKEICPSKLKLSSESEPTNVSTPCKVEEIIRKIGAHKKMDEVIMPETPKDMIPIENSMVSPWLKTGSTMLDSKKRMRKRSKSNKPVELESNSVTVDVEKAGIGSSKRRRKTWTSLKEIAERREQNNSSNVTNITIPFFI